MIQAMGKPGRSLVAFLLLLLATFLPTPSAGAGLPTAGGDDRAGRIGELEGLVGELSADEAAALRELGEVRAHRRELDAEISRLSDEVAASEARLGEASAAVDQLTARYLDLDAQRADAQGALRDARARFTAAAVALYQSGGAETRAASLLVLDTANPLDVGAGSAYLEQISHVRRDAVDVLEDLEHRIDELISETERSRTGAARARATAEAERDRIAELRAREQIARNAVAAEEAREAQIVRHIRERKADYEAELASLRATSNAITSLLQERQAGQTRGRSFSVERPVPGAITSGFGLRMHPILGTTRMHNGIDMHADYGTAVRAGARGVVVWSGVRDGYGNTVIVDHGNQYATLYAHLSQLWVDAGDHVRRGREVGAVGATGLATGPHLHFEVRLLGVPINPVTYM
jgi:murein DD-endopeptidase MepM/ murein hydrolase activator NlpD